MAIAAALVVGTVTILAPSITPLHNRGTETFEVFSALELDCMRADAEGFMPDEVVVYRRNDVPDGMGSVSREWVAQTAIQGRLVPMGISSAGGERVYGGSLVSTASWTLNVPFGTYVESWDRVLANGYMHEVQEVVQGRSWQLFLQLRLTRIAP